jgi:hypothetical protein
MINQGLFDAAIVFASVIAGIGAVTLLALAAWRVRSPLATVAQRRSAARDLRHAARDNDAPRLTGTPHPVH